MSSADGDLPFLFIFSSSYVMGLYSTLEVQPLTYPETSGASDPFYDVRIQHVQRSAASLLLA
jgi:hypothetical protein